MRSRLFVGLFWVYSSVFAQVQHYQLANGLNLVVKEDHRTPVVMSMVWYDVGSFDEPEGLTGISHALEHMMFKGTAKNPLDTYSKTIQQLGGQENAVTSSDYTTYFALISAADLPAVFSLEADRMAHLLFDQNEFSREIKVVKEERRLRTDNKPQAFLLERFLATAHLSPPYQHPVVGWMSDLKQLQLNDLQAWYKKHYAPNHATLVVVGDVKGEEVFNLAKQYFANIPAGEVFKRKHLIEPPNVGIKVVEVNMPAQVPMLILGYTAPTLVSISPKNIDDPYVLEVIAGILGAGDGARLNKELVNKKQIASDAQIYYDLNSRYETQFMLYGIPTATHTLLDLKQGFLHELQRLQTSLIDPQELQRVKTQIIAQKIFERDSVYDQAMELGRLEVVGLNGQTAAQYVEKINAVTPQSIQMIAQRYFKNNTFTEGRLIPIKKPANKDAK